MKPIFLAALLAIMQANPPVPGKTVGNTNNQQNPQQSKGASPQTPSDQTGTANKLTTANPNQQNTPTQTEKSTSSPESIIMQGHPDITIRKDVFDYLYIFGSLLLTLITLGIAGLAWKQANVALLNVKAIVDSERAWVLLDIVKPEGINGDTVNAPQGIELPVSVQLKNFGKTPAWVIDWCCKFVRADVAEFQGPMDYGSSKPGGDYAVAPNGGIFPIFPEGGTPVIRLSDIERIRLGQRSLVLYGLVRYRDVFETKNQPIRETYFCVHLLVYAYGPAANWQLTGPSGANRCT